MINFYCHLWLAILCLTFKTDGILVRVWPVLLIFSTKGLFFKSDIHFGRFIVLPVFFFVMTWFRLSSINLYDTTPLWDTHVHVRTIVLLLLVLYSMENGINSSGVGHVGL